MDGYSVHEAAAVLGVPEGRVWELLARGVLAGSTEVGGDMRVFLREIAVAEAPKPTGSNGNGGHGNGGELTPFRELLTEFRNLTERYGQALLALGEARGEVASLRGRVDLLEARIEHRPPWTEVPSTEWQAGFRPEDRHVDEPPAVEPPAVEPPAAEAALAAEPPAEIVAEAETDADPTTEPTTEATLGSEAAAAPPPAEHTESAPKSSRGSAKNRSRAAVSGFAEALARAEDPTTASVGPETDELPGARDAADAMAAYRRETDAGHGPDPAEAETVDEPALATAETLAVADTSVVRVGYNTATPEPDWIAEEDLYVPAGSAPDARDEETSVGTASAEAAAEEPDQGTVEEPLPILAVTADEWAGDEPEAAVETFDAAVAMDIAAEPPAHDDVALLVGAPDFSEPPQVPREPAFWEPDAPSPPPFAVPHLDTWEAPVAEAVRTEVRVAAPFEPAPVEPAPVEPAPVEGAAVEPARSTPEEPRPPRSVPVMASPEPARLEPEAADQPAPPTPTPVIRASSPTTRRRRGPAARAIRRLRLLLD